VTTTDGTCWYFGYGSNMSPQTFLERRGMQPLETRVARLEGWSLCFDLPVGPGERAVANLWPAPDTHIWGVVYRLGAADCERLDRSEGVPQGVYDRLEVQVCCAAEPAVLTAFTYQSRHRRDGRRPSARYLGIMLDGARHHRLPADWVAYLERFELAVDEREPVTKGPSS
jgi:cation transport regulator ChaC